MQKINGQFAEELFLKYGSPLFVYDADHIKNQIKLLNDAGPDFHLSYAMKANANQKILQFLQQNGVNSVDVVSPGEIYKAKKNGFKSQHILYTQNFISEQEMDFAIKQGVTLNIGALDTLKHFSKKLQGKQIFIRINPDLGAGENYKVITGGPQSKFGISKQDIQETIKFANQANIKIVGLHQHIGSNLKAQDEDVYMKTIQYIFNLAQQFKELKYVNIGGGFGIKYKPVEQLFHLGKLFQRIRDVRDKTAEKIGHKLQIWMQPGRFIMGEAGVLLCRITAKKKTSQRTFIGTNTGFNHLIRPALYKSHHEIVNVSNPDCEKQKVTVCGNICESSDNLGVDIQLGGKIGEILAIQNAGAYCFSMSSNYNERLRPAQILLQGETVTLIRRRQTYEDLADLL